MAVLPRETWGNLSFLVVDDTNVVRAMLEMMLLALGAAKVRLAEDGEQALAAVVASPADIVISDLNMTPMSGLELLRALRSQADPKVNSVPVLVVSGYGEDAVYDEVMAAGANAFATKPVKPDSLEAKIREILESPAFQAATELAVVRARG